LKDDDDVSRKMMEDMIRMRRFTRNIPLPSAPKRYDPNEPPFDRGEILGMETDDFEGENDDLEEE
jgi:hypothetical protein